MTEEEYKDKRRRIEANIVDAKATLNRAKYNFDKLCEDLRHLRMSWEFYHKERQD